MSIKISKTGVGAADNGSTPIHDSTGTGMLPIQAQGDGATSFRVMGRVSPDAPWVEVIAAATADFLQSIAWVPYLQLDVTAGTGTVTLWIGEK